MQDNTIGNIDEIKENRDENTQGNMQENIEEEMYDDGPGLDKQGAFYRAMQEGEYVSPCGYCNRGDCIECRFSR